MNELLRITNTETAEGLGSESLTRYTFNDGTTYSALRYGEEASITLIHTENGNVPSPLQGRYPFTESVAELALRYHDATGHLPEALGNI